MVMNLHPFNAQFNEITSQTKEIPLKNLCSRPALTNMSFVKNSKCLDQIS